MRTRHSKFRERQVVMYKGKAHGFKIAQVKLEDGGFLYRPWFAEFWVVEADIRRLVKEEIGK